MPALPILTRSQQGILFGGLRFTAPVPLRLTYRRTLASGSIPLSTTRVPNYGGLYVVMLYDSTWKPMPYRPIYFGEAVSLPERVCRNHEKYNSWWRAACGAQLFIAFHCIQSMWPRKAAERRLIEHYNPACNIVHNHLRKLMDLA